MMRSTLEYWLTFHDDKMASGLSINISGKRCQAGHQSSLECTRRECISSLIMIMKSMTITQSLDIKPLISYLQGYICGLDSSVPDSIQRVKHRISAICYKASNWSTCHCSDYILKNSDFQVCLFLSYCPCYCNISQ